MELIWNFEGKLILNEGDLTNNLAIREFATEDSEHRKLWQATRREIVCMADYIVPGWLIALGILHFLFN
jgi:hypothetical protein